MLITTHKDAVSEGLGDVVVALAEVAEPTAAVEPMRRTRLERWHIVALAVVIIVLVALIVLQIVDQAEDGGRILVRPENSASKGEGRVAAAARKARCAPLMSL
jgi:hypothetical protein